MFHRLSWRTLFLGLLCLVPVGCEPHRSWIRPKDGDEMMERVSRSSEDDEDSRKIIGGSSDDADAKTFFKKNRLSGGWSKEAREIESHLGAD